jgi:hypothetical protein
MKMPIEQSLIAAQDPHNAVALGDGRSNNRPDAGVHPRRVSAAAKNSDFHGFDS